MGDRKVQLTGCTCALWFAAVLSLIILLQGCSSSIFDDGAVPVPTQNTAPGSPTAEVAIAPGQYLIQFLVGSAPIEDIHKSQVTWGYYDAQERFIPQVTQGFDQRGGLFQSVIPVANVPPVIVVIANVNFTQPILSDRTFTYTFNKLDFPNGLSRSLKFTDEWCNTKVVFRFINGVAEGDYLVFEWTCKPKTATSTFSGYSGTEQLKLMEMRSKHSLVLLKTFHLPLQDVDEATVTWKLTGRLGYSDFEQTGVFATASPLETVTITQGVVF